MTCHYPDLGSASNCFKQISLAVRPIRSTTQDLASDTSSEWNFCTCSSGVTSRETSNGVAKCRLFSQATSRLKAGGSTYMRQHLSVRTLSNWDSSYYFRNFKLFYRTSKIVKLFYTFLLQKLSNCSILSDSYWYER